MATGGPQRRGAPKSQQLGPSHDALDIVVDARDRDGAAIDVSDHVESAAPAKGSPVAPAAAPAPRQHWMDWLRFALTVLVVAHHVVVDYNRFAYKSARTLPEQLTPIFGVSDFRGSHTRRSFRVQRLHAHTPVATPPCCSPAGVIRHDEPGAWPCGPAWLAHALALLQPRSCGTPRIPDRPAASRSAAARSRRPA